MKFSTPKTEKAAAAEFLPGLFNSALGLEGQPILRLEERVTQLYDELSLPVYRYLLCLGMGPSEASDVIQETFLRLYRHLHAGRREDKLRGWVFRVAHNLALNLLKSHKHLDLDESAVINRSAPDPDPEDSFSTRRRWLGCTAPFLRSRRSNAGAYISAPRASDIARLPKSLM